MINLNYATISVKLNKYRKIDNKKNRESGLGENLIIKIEQEIINMTLLIDLAISSSIYLHFKLIDQTHYSFVKIGNNIKFANVNKFIVLLQKHAFFYMFINKNKLQKLCFRGF